MTPTVTSTISAASAKPACCVTAPGLPNNCAIAIGKVVESDRDKNDVAPVVVTVPLSHALDKPIIANLDANHQIESIRSEGSWVPKGDHI
jgi:hypothetical protein